MLFKKQANFCGSRVAIVGVGCVGSTIAYTLMLDGVASKIALIDVNKKKADGEALELLHCMQFAHTVDVVAGDSMELVDGADIVVLTAGFAQKPGQSRVDLLAANVNVFKEIIPQVVKYNKECLLLVVTNPLDVLTYVTLKLSGFPPCRVLGTGTVLDSSRLRYQIGSHFNVSPKDVIAHILGEHGDSEFVWWSGASVAGIPLSLLPQYNRAFFDQMYQKTKNAAADIIACKGATYYAIALVTTKIIRAILLNQARVFSVSSFIENQYGLQDVCLSVPTIVRKSGICDRLNLPLNDEEQHLFAASAEKIKCTIAKAVTLL